MAEELNPYRAPEEESKATLVAGANEKHVARGVVAAAAWYFLGLTIGVLGIAVLAYVEGKVSATSYFGSEAAFVLTLLIFGMAGAINLLAFSIYLPLRVWGRNLAVTAWLPCAAGVAQIPLIVVIELALSVFPVPEHWELPKILTAWLLLAIAAAECTLWLSLLPAAVKRRD